MMFEQESDEETGTNGTIATPKNGTIDATPKNGTIATPKNGMTNTLKNGMATNDDNISVISSEGLNQTYIIDNLSPTWGIMLVIQDNLNLRIGVQVKKKYFNAAFWNYISTPINFAITLFTALTAGQTGSSATFLTDSQIFYILVATFVLSTVNTFFKLREKADINYKSAKMWESYAAAFERIYFTPITDVQMRLSEYTHLIEKINEEGVEESVEYVNYITELVFYLCHMCHKSVDHRYLSIHRRHWVLDGISYELYARCLMEHPNKATIRTMVPMEIDPTIFRKELAKMTEQPSARRRFMGLFD